MPIQAIGNDSTDRRGCAYRAAEKRRGFRGEVCSLLSVTGMNLIPPPICLEIEASSEMKCWSQILFAG
jgi:hypothetical protein